MNVRYIHVVMFRNKIFILVDTHRMLLDWLESVMEKHTLTPFTVQ